MVIFLGSPTALQTVWVLLELYEATQRDIPIIVVAASSTWQVGAALEYLERLEANLARSNPQAIDVRAGDPNADARAPSLVRGFLRDVCATRVRSAH